MPEAGPDITSLNRRYLEFAKYQAQQDIDEAARLTGISKNILVRLAEASMDTIDDLAGAEVLLFAPRLNDTAMRDLLDGVESGDKREKKSAKTRALLQAQAAIG